MNSELTTLLEQVRDLLRSQANKIAFPDKSFLTVKHAAEYSDLSPESIRRLVQSGKLTALRPVKGRIVIDRKELDTYIRSCDKRVRTGRGLHRS